MMSGVNDKRKRMKSSAEKKRRKDKVPEVVQPRDKEENYDKFRKKKQRKNQIVEHEAIAANKVDKEAGFVDMKEGNEKRNLSKKKKKNVKKVRMDAFDNEVLDEMVQQNVRSNFETQVENVSHEDHTGKDTRTSIKTSKSMKARKKKKKQLTLSREDQNLSENKDSTEDDIYQISSGDEDCFKGMKKWIMDYHQRRPGLNVLQERIDDFITEHEARVEQERKEREAQAAEDGWTVVVHHKGRKKTTDTESGVVVGSVAQATVVNNMTKKKAKQVGLDFYRFQKREAQRNEVMMLQSKFEQDKKRIQQMRAARKFRPY